MTVFLGTLWISIKEVKAPYMFDVEHGIALQAMQVNRASSRSEGEVSWFFSNCSRILGFPLELRRGWPLRTRVCSVTSGLLSNCKEHLGILLETSQGNSEASRGEAGDPGCLSSCHRDVGIPINLQEESGIAYF